MRRYISLAGLLLLLTAAADAQPLRFERITVDDGLSGNWVRALVQDRQGFIWIGTQEGLNRHDGYGFETFRYRPGDPTSLSDNAITSILEDRSGRLWVGTLSGLNRFEPSTGTFTRFGVADGLRHATVRVIHEDRSGALWIGTNRGLNRWQPSTQTFVAYPNLTPQAGHADDNITAIHEGRDGRLWIGTQLAGLALFDAESGGYRTVEGWGQSVAPGLSSEIGLIHEDSRGNLWIATWDDPQPRPGAGLHRYDRETAEVQTYLFSDHEVTDIYLNLSAIIENDDGTFWLTAFGAPAAGLHHFEPETGTFTRHNYDTRNPWSLTWGYSTALLRDHSGILWVGTSRGLNKLDLQRSRFGHFKENHFDQFDLRDNIYPILEDESGRLWMGLDGPGGLMALDRAGGVVTRYDVTQAAVWSIARDADGRLWLGSTSGLFHFDTQTGRARLHRVPSDAQGFANIITALYMDSGEHLWVGSQDGLTRYDPRTNTYSRYRHDPDDPTSLSGNRIRVIREDRHGHIWIGTGPLVNDASGVGAEGLSRLDPRTGAIQVYRHDPGDPASLSNNGVNAILEDASGTIWVGTDNGLNRYDPATGTFRYFLQEDGLAGPLIVGILEDDAGRLWISTQSGLSRFDPRTETFKNYGVEDGLQNRRFNVGSYHRSTSGEMFFGGVSGLNYFFPEQITENPIIPPVVLTSFRRRSGQEDHAAYAGGEIELSHRESGFTFEFSALNFRAPEKNQFAYRLEGFDSDWVAAGTRRFGSYTNLPPGRYTLRVKGSNNDGVWNEEGVSLRIRILPPWWRSWWAYGFYGLLLAGGVFGADRYQRRRLMARERERARERELEQAREIERAYHELEQAHRHLKDAQAQLVQQEKLASLGALTAGIAHEIKNPLNFVNNFSDLSAELIEELRGEIDRVEARLTEEELKSVASLLTDLRVNLTKIAEHGRRADGIVRSMLEHSRGGKGERQAVDVNALVEEYVNLAYHGKRAQQPGFDVEVKREYSPDVGEVEVVPQEIGRVILNLVGNAFDAVAERGSSSSGDGYAPAVRIQTLRRESTVEVRVADNGPGIPEDMRQRVFEPFFTTKAAGSGTGLGLSLSHEIVTQGHGGELRVESESAAGATFIIILPIP